MYRISFYIIMNYGMSHEKFISILFDIAHKGELDEGIVQDFSIVLSGNAPHEAFLHKINQKILSNFAIMWYA